MPKKAKEISALEVKRLSTPGFHPVGGVPGLHLRINDGAGKSWILRVVVQGKRRDIGLGGFPDISLASARDAARAMRAKIHEGIDPIEERAQERQRLAAERSRALTLADAIEQFLTSGKLDALSNPKHRAQWRSTLDTYVVPVIGKKRLVDINVADIKSVLDPIWQTKHETARRVRSRIEAVISWATVHGLRGGDNPARWQANLKELMPDVGKAAIKHHRPALPVRDVQAWFAELKTREGLAARALEFLTLTATRSQEVRFATWEEIDLEGEIWTIPAERMKMRREHRVPLSPSAMELLRTQPRMAGTELVFPSSRNGVMSDMTLSAVMRRMDEDKTKLDRVGWPDPVLKRPAVPHGLRSTFRDWVSEKTEYPSDMAEVALAHKVGNAVEQAYRRGDMLAKRRQMMVDWAAFISA
ncbi:site-specific integrase [Paenirhodobacter sp. CAU 1674]|uniref:tyrosine-type recombinase/integrase n=1 Tax=Paenirhodobacter sp. CAU 1674 TaxID=3032596 RepID=UPI0023DB1237|nr:site-specific integrase [Paenirhodobacter sp. CAU 1674]MDF2141734.1 tyrosine-type recombinase/integrase [Paenirhodobacter sp. CAU 1674]